MTGISQANPQPGVVSNTSGVLNGVANPTFSYDANGNQLSGAGRTITWSSFNIPSQIVSCRGGDPAACKTTSFTYNPEHERTVEHQTDGSTVVTLSPRYDTGLHFEKRSVPATAGQAAYIEYEHYLYAGGLMFGKYITQTNAAGTPIRFKDMANTFRGRVIQYYLKDHLGSITAQINGDANPDFLADGVTPNPKAGKYAIRYLSYDIWGKQRHPNGAADPTGQLNNPDMYHGFTGHEMLDDVGLIHMNGRLYDPMMARFVSADPYIQSPDNLQSYNRYSYGWNNPLAGTDPSGYLFGIIDVPIVDNAWHNHIKPAVVSAWHSVWRSDIGQAAVQVGLDYVFGPALGTAIYVKATGGSWEDAAKAAIIAHVTAKAYGQVGTATNGHEVTSDYFMTPNHIANMAGHAVVGCASAAASGGDCGRGALSAAVGSFATPLVAGLGKEYELVAVSIVGGTASYVGGGKFSNGAVTAAMGYLYNQKGGECKTDFCKISQSMKEHGNPLDYNLSEEQKATLSSSFDILAKTSDAVSMLVVFIPGIGVPIATGLQGISTAATLGSAYYSTDRVRALLPTGLALEMQGMGMVVGMSPRSLIITGVVTSSVMDRAVNSGK